MLGGHAEHAIPVGAPTGRGSVLDSACRRPQQGVPTRDLRRRRRARRRAGPGAARAVRPRDPGARLRRAARRAADRVVRRPRRAGQRQRGAQDAGRGPRRSPTAARAPTWCTRTPGTPTSPATSPSLLYGVPHVVSAHSLEPLRPWKAEQLGGGYAVSSWVEKTSYEAAAAVIAVSAAMRDDVLRVLPRDRPGPRARRAQRHRHRGLVAGRRPRPGPRAWASTRTARRWSSSAGSPARRGCRCSCARSPQLPPEVQIVLCAGAPDTPEIEAEVVGLADGLAKSRDGRGVDPRDAAAPRRDRAAHRRDGVRVPVDLRAARHRQPRGDGLRDRGRGHRHRRHPRGRRRRRDRPAGADRAGQATAPAPRSTRSGTSPTSPPRSTRSSATPSAPPRWARPAGSAPSTRSAGARSRSGPWRSTAPSL